MKRHLPSIVAAVLAFTGLALGAAYTGAFGGIDASPRYLKGGFFAGSGSTANTANRVTNMLAGSTTYDFPALGNAPVDTPCATTWPVTVSGASGVGARIGDPCAVASDLGTDGGAVLLSTAQLTCQVTAAAQATVKLCVHLTDGGSYNLGDAGFFVRTFSNQ
jgi:hypothetical protein